MMASNDPMEAVDYEPSSDENGTRQSSLDRIKMRKQKVSRNTTSFILKFKHNVLQFYKMCFPHIY